MISSPYKGLHPFDDSDHDALLFFGRNRDAQVIEANVLASRFTVLYGASGVGKSSVLQARVVRELRALPEHPAVAVFSAWSEDAIAGIAGAVAEAAGIDAEATLAETLAAATDARREVYLILDQAEELFLYRGAVHDVVLDLPEAAAAPGVRVNVLVSIRDDSVALLDRFKRRLPDLLANTLRLDRLDRASARLAVVGPLAAYAGLGGEGPSEAEDEVVERVLDEVGAGRILQQLAGAGGDEPGGGVEAPYLQLVLQRLWDVERDAGSTVLRAQTLAGLGGAQRIVADHLESAVGALDEEGRDVAASAFRFLVTPSGTKIAYDVPDLAGYAGVAEPALLPVLDELADRRILRTVGHGGDDGVARFEIFHDVLADAVLAWRARHLAGAELRAEREEARRRHRNAARLAGAALAALIVVGAVAIYAFTQREEARAQARVAEARAIAAAALERLPFDPELGLVLALRALDREYTPQTEGVLRKALLASRVRDVERVGEPLTDASPVGADIVVATSDGAVRAGARTVVEGGLDVRSHLEEGRAITVTSGEVRVHSLPAGALVRRMAIPAGARLVETTHDGERTVVARGPRTAALLDRDGSRVTSLAEAGDVVAAAFSRGGRLLATGSRDRIGRLWNAGDGRFRFELVGHAGQITDVAFSPKGTIVATASTDGTGRVWSTESGALIAVLVGHVGSVDDVEISPDGLTVATAGEDRTARVWQADTGGPVALLAGHSEPVASVAFNHSGRRVVTASEDGTVRAWDAVDQRPLVVAADLGRPVTRADVAREAGVDPARDAEIRIDGGLVHLAGTTLRGHNDVVNTARRSKDHRFVVTASRDHHARIFDAASGRLLRTLIGHAGAVADASFSPDGRWVVTAGPSTAALWDAATGEHVFWMRGHRGLLTAAAFDASGTRIVTGGIDGTVRAHRCGVCAPADGLVALARERLERTGRTLTADERLRFLP